MVCFILLYLNLHTQGRRAYYIFGIRKGQVAIRRARYYIIILITLIACRGSIPVGPPRLPRRASFMDLEKADILLSGILRPVGRRTTNL